jgi:hypothetical protein
MHFGAVNRIIQGSIPTAKDPVGFFAHTQSGKPPSLQLLYGYTLSYQSNSASPILGNPEL